MAKFNSTNKALSTDLIYDVVIVGAGMSGSLLALSLLQKDKQLSILLLDENAEREATKNSHVAENPSFDGRCIALNAGSLDILNELALWEEIKPKAQVITKIEVSDKGYFGSLNLIPENYSNFFGYVVELQHVGKALSAKLSSFSSLTILYNTKLKAIEQKVEHTRCYLSDGQIIQAKLCVGADGTNSQTRELTKIDSTTMDYHCSAVICNVRCSVPHHNIAYERFTENGPIALLPLTDNRYSLVYCVKNDQAEEVKALSNDAFLQRLQKAFGYRAGIFKEVGKRDVYPLSLVMTKKPLSHRVVCIGNAAHSLHPVAGQGFNLGLRDLHVLAKVIVTTEPKDLGTFSMLARYWEYRKADHNRTILMTDTLVRVFSNHDHTLSIPRNISLQAMSLFPALTQPVIKQAKGQFDLFNRENLS